MNKKIMISAIVVICVGLLLLAAWMQPIIKESPNKKEENGPEGTKLVTYQDSVVEPGTNQVNGLLNEDWFGEIIKNDELTFATENLGNTEFNSTENDQNAYGDGDAAPKADTGAESSLEAEENDRWADDTGLPREIEEADIIKLDDDALYILNTYRGLLIVDVSTPDEPELVSRVPLFGYPVEMYIVEPKAYVILTHYYNAFLWAEDTDEEPGYRHGSEIVVIDISDHSKPKVEQFIELDGFITDTRRVGEVIYAVANDFDGYFGIDVGMPRVAMEESESFGRGSTESSDAVEVKEEPAIETGNETGSSSSEPEPDLKEDPDEETLTSEDEMDTKEGTFVVSINMEDLTNIREVDREWFAGSSNEIHVTENAIFVAQPVYNYYQDPVFGWRDEYYTKVTYVDISDYHGQIKTRDDFKVDGSLEDRYQMDYYEDTFRIVTHFRGSWGELGSSTLWIYDVANPDDITKLGSLDIDDAGTLMATRFAGERAYTIHLPKSVDPLDVLDLSDPSKPVLTDILEMPGWVTHMEVRGLKILALGVDDSDGKQRVAVSLFDVTDPKNAVMKERVIIGEGYSWSTANWDPKALTVIDDQNLMLVPFDSYSYDELGRYESFSGLQIVKFDLDANDLTAGGTIEHMGTIQRTRANSERIFAISTQLLQVIDARDITKPKITATLELANNVVDILPMGDYCVQIISDYDYNKGGASVRLRTVSADKPDTTEFLVEKTLDYNMVKLFTNDDMIYLAVDKYNPEEKQTEGRILVYDYSDPKAPKLKGNFLIDDYNQGYYYWGYYYDWYWSPRANVLEYNFELVDGDVIVYHPSPEYQYYYEPTDDVVYDEPASDGSLNETKEENRTESEEPPEEEKILVPEPSYTSTLTEKLYIIDLSDPSAPKAAGNITFVNASRITGMHAKGDTLYLIQYDEYSGYDANYRWQYVVKYYLTKIDLTAPNNPVVGNPINIPGEYLGINNAGTIVYTRSSAYDEDYNWKQTLNVLKLDADKATLTSALDLGTDYPDVIIQDTTILLSYNVYGWYYLEEIDYAINGLKIGTDGSKEPEFKMKVQIIDASNPSKLVLKTTLGLKNYGSIFDFDNDELYIRLSDANGFVIYDLTDLSSPAFMGYYPTQGSIMSLREDISTGKIYLACGWYGVLMIEVEE